MRYTSLIFLILLFSCQIAKPDFISQPKEIISLHEYESEHLEIASVIFDIQNEKWYLFNEDILKTRFSPASTFKIVNSLIGLQTKQVSSIEEKWLWDGKIRQNEKWNSDQNMREAFKNSTVWFYQRLAKNIGQDNMRSYLKEFNYGNQKIADSIHTFWLDGSLEISPLEQVSFLYNLHKKKFSLDKNVYDQVKSIMYVKTLNGADIYAKTGWGFNGKKDIGWYVGIVEINGKSFVFVTLLLSDDYEKINNFGLKRIEISERALKLAKIIP